MQTKPFGEPLSRNPEKNAYFDQACSLGIARSIESETESTQAIKRGTFRSPLRQSSKEPFRLLTSRKSYGRGKSLNAPKVRFRVERATWVERQKGQDCRRNQCKRKKEGTAKRPFPTSEKSVPLKEAT
jgi:hypothetical protein